MKPIIYEIKRAITSKSALAVLAFMILIPSLIAFSSASGDSAPSYLVHQLSYGWGSNGTYNGTVLLYNSYGQQVSGLAVTYTVGQNNTTVNTNSKGFANTTFNGVTNKELGITSPDQVGRAISFSYEYSSYYGPFARELLIYQNQTNPYFTNDTIPTYGTNGSINTTFSTSRYSFQIFNVKNNPRLNGLVLTYNAADITLDGNPVYLYYKKAANTTQVYFGTGSETYTSGKNSYTQTGSPGAYTESEMTFFASYGQSPMIDILPGNLTTHTNSTLYWFELFTSNGTELAYAEIQLVNQYSQTAVSGLFFSSELPLLTIFVPLMAVLSAYQTFGKDKANGSLASVIIRPISRRALMISRFASNLISVMVASSAAVGISSLIYYYYLAVYIPPGALLLSLWAILVMTGAFVGLVYLASMLLKSSVQIIGVALGIFFMLSLLWTLPLPVVPLLISSVAIKEPIGSLAYASSLVRMDFFSPAALTSVVAFVSGYNSSALFFYGGNYTATQLGINLTSVIIAGLVWIAIPIALAILKFVKYD